MFCRADFEMLVFREELLPVNQSLHIRQDRFRGQLSRKSCELGKYGEKGGICDVPSVLSSSGRRSESRNEKKRVGDPVSKGVGVTVDPTKP